MSENTALKVSVLAGGEVLVHGQAVTLEALGAALDQATKEDAAVWYYREDAAGEPPPVALRVMKMIVDHRLAVRLSTRPDFSDAVTPDKTPEEVFSTVRAKAAQRLIVTYRPDGKLLLLPAMARETAKPELVATAEQMIPSKVQRNIAVIGETGWTVAANLNVHLANEMIPFFGILLGFACIGHCVWIFDADAAILSAGCRDADVLIVDSAKLESLPAGWQETVAQTMRSRQILVHDRATYRLRKA